MALIDCPSCNKKISDKTEQCNHCGFAMGNASEDDIARKRNLQKYLKSQSIQTQSLIAMLMFVAGFVWYIVNRVRLVFVKKSN